MDYILIAKELLRRLKQERGTGRSHISKHGLFSSDRHPTLVSPHITGAKGETYGAVNQIRRRSFKDIENGCLLGSSGPTVLTHTAQEVLLEELLAEIVELKEDNQRLSEHLTACMNMLRSGGFNQQEKQKKLKIHMCRCHPDKRNISEFRSLNGAGVHEWSIYCTCCGLDTGVCHTREEAVKTWNKMVKR